MPKWIRAKDNRDRWFTFLLEGERLRMYYPNVDGNVFEYVGFSQSGRTDFGRPVRYVFENYSATSLDSLLQQYNVDHHFEPETPPGVYHPRMHRGPESPHPRDVGLLEAWTSTIRSSRLLLDRLRDVFRVVEPAPRNADVYGHELRQLLIMACTEIESAWKAVLVANGFTPSQNGRWNTGHYVKVLRPMHLDGYEVSLSAYPSYGVLKPFERWDAAQPTGSLWWYDAYNAVKHDREANLERATFRAAVEALAALFVMRVAQFGPVELDEESYFHADEFKLERSPGAWGSWYTRPMPTFDGPPVWQPYNWVLKSYAF